MKNLLFTLVLLFSLHSFAQHSSFSNPVADAFIILASNHTSGSEAMIVPDDKYMIVTDHIDGASGQWAYSSPEYYNATGYSLVSGANNGDLLPSGTMIWCDGWNSTTPINYNIILTVHNYNTSTSLSSTDVELPNQIRLFPNPTTSKVALNSDKQYDIEVYDILGNKVMELTGNTIDMEHLSSATYIVNALDTETNERLSYKVVKH
jgi:hypothetical protein